MGYAREHLETKKKIEVPSPQYKVPLRGKSLDHFGGTGIKSGVKYSIVLGNRQVLPALDCHVPERNMRHRVAHRANRIPVKYILRYDPAANERRNVEALSVNRRKSCDIGQ